MRYLPGTLHLDLVLGDGTTIARGSLLLFVEGEGDEDGSAERERDRRPFDGSRGPALAKTGCSTIRRERGQPRRDLLDVAWPASFLCSEIELTGEGALLFSSSTSLGFDAFILVLLLPAPPSAGREQPLSPAPHQPWRSQHRAGSPQQEPRTTQKELRTREDDLGRRRPGALASGRKESASRGGGSGRRGGRGVRLSDVEGRATRA